MLDPTLPKQSSNVSSDQIALNKSKHPSLPTEGKTSSLAGEIISSQENLSEIPDKPIQAISLNVPSEDNDDFADFDILALSQVEESKECDVSENPKFSTEDDSPHDDSPHIDIIDPNPQEGKYELLQSEEVDTSPSSTLISDEIKKLELKEKNLNPKLEFNDKVEQELENMLSLRKKDKSSNNFIKDTLDVIIEDTIIKEKRTERLNIPDLITNGQYESELSVKTEHLSSLEDELEETTQLIEKHLSEKKIAEADTHALRLVKDIAVANVNLLRSKVENYKGLNASTGILERLSLDQFSQKYLAHEDIYHHDGTLVAETEKKQAFETIQLIALKEAEINDTEQKINDNQEKINHIDESLSKDLAKASHLREQIAQLRTQIQQLQQAIASQQETKKSENTPESIQAPLVNKSENTTKTANADEKNARSFLQGVEQRVKKAELQILQRNQLMNKKANELERQKELDKAQAKQRRIKEDDESYDYQQGLIKTDHLQQDLRDLFYKHRDQKEADKIIAVLIQELQKNPLNSPAETIEIKEFVQRVLTNAKANFSRNEEKLLIEKLGRFLAVKGVKRA